MKRKWTFFFFLFPFILNAQNVALTDEATIPYGEGPLQVPFTYGYITGSSPSWFIFWDGETCLLNCNGFYECYNVHSKSIARKIEYPDKSSYFPFEYQREAYSVYPSEKGIIGRSGNFTTALTNTEKSQLSSFNYFQYSNHDGSLFRLRQIDELCIGCTETPGGIFGILPDGSIVDPREYLGMDRIYAKPFWRLGDEAKEAQKRLREGKYLIVDGLLHPASFKELRDYFEAVGMKLEYDRPRASTDDNKEPYGQSFNGDMYFPDRSDIRVFDQCGKVQAVIALHEIDPWVLEKKPEGGFARRFNGPFVAVHPNGDVYVLTAVEGDCARVWKAARGWGTDYLAIARRGLPEKRDPKLLAELESLSDQELRIVRNALFALRGYAFKAVDLRNYFQGYDWYAPDPAVQSDPAILEPPSRRLFEAVSAMEERRKEEK